MQQLLIPYPLDLHSFRAYIEKAADREIEVVITDNSFSMLSVKKKNKTVLLRAQRIFLSADSRVLDELAAFINDSRIKTPHIRNFINQNHHTLQKKQQRRVNVRTRGDCYNLCEMFHLINNEYFGGNVSASITWGARRPRRAAARRTLGSYCLDNNMIRINPILDNRRVPRYFVEFIVYHEMLHADIGIERGAKRRALHSGEFRRREKMFARYDRAIAWEKKRW